MTRTRINLDTRALREAAAELGTSTNEDTVNAALREIAARGKRLKLLAALDQSDFGKPEVMRGIWRDWPADT